MKECIICHERVDDGISPLSYYICAECDKYSEMHEKKEKEWLKQVNYRVQSDLPCCENCSHSRFNPDGDIFCEEAPKNERWGLDLFVDNLGICNKYQKRK